MVKLLATFILLLLIVNISISSVNNVIAQNSTSTENPTMSTEDLLLLNINLEAVEAVLALQLNFVLAQKLRALLLFCLYVSISFVDLLKFIMLIRSLASAVSAQLSSAPNLLDLLNVSMSQFFVTSDSTQTHSELLISYNRSQHSKPTLEKQFFFFSF